MGYDRNWKAGTTYLDGLQSKTWLDDEMVPQKRGLPEFRNGLMMEDTDLALQFGRILSSPSDAIFT